MTVVLFAGGGTGGHLMPALAIAEAMVERDRRVEPYFLGGERGIEARVLPARPWRYSLLPFEPIYRRQWWKNARLPFSMYRALKGVRALLSREKPALAVGTGGYVSGPVVWAAVNRGVPALIQEQNAFPGFATRRLASRVRQVHLGFPEAAAYLRPGPNTQVVESGNPIVPPPPPAERPQRSAAKQRLGFASDQPLVLIFGGSQGALPINRAVDEALGSGLWPRGVSLLWQTGSESLEKYRHRGVEGRVKVDGFIDPMADAYAAADLAVGRAGAITLAELAAWALPAILIPLPGAAANHQLGNARAMAAAQAAVLLRQEQATAERLVGTITGLLRDPARMADISAAASARARPEAAAQIASAALRLLAIS